MRKNNNSTWNTQRKTQLYHTLLLQAQHKIMIMHVWISHNFFLEKGGFPPTQINKQLNIWYI